jgi:hypothetical protein
VLPSLAATRAPSRRALGLRRRAEMSGPLADAVARVAHVLGAPRPLVYADPDQVVPVRIAMFSARRGVGLALIVGSPFLKGRLGEAEFLFIAASRLACLRPERLARHALPDPDALAAIASAARTLAAAGDDPSQAHLPAFFDGLPPLVLAQIAALGHHLDAQAATPAAAKRWLRAADATAARAGFVLAGDLGASVRALEADQGVAVTPLAERVADLARSSIRDELAEVVSALEEPAEPADAPGTPRPLAAAQAAAGVLSQ